MLQTRAIVIRLEGRDALVESTQGGGCGNCDSEGGCGSGKLSQLFCSEPRRFRVRNEGNAQVGSLVDVVVPEGVLLNSALLMYILPLLMLLFGAMVGSKLTPDAASVDAYSAMGALAGLAAGFFLVKFISSRRRLSASAQPVVLPLES
jgi:sigma-E factor negative regulatory protein RseC